LDDHDNELARLEAADKLIAAQKAEAIATSKEGIADA